MVSLTTIIAGYGAVISTVAIWRQIRSDRVRIKITVDKLMHECGDRREDDEPPDAFPVVVMTVTNLSKRPVTIRTFGAASLFPLPRLVAVRSSPQVPWEITEGKSVESMWDKDEIDFSTIDYWEAWDSRGKMHKLQVASRFKHLKSVFQRRMAARKREKMLREFDH